MNAPIEQTSYCSFISRNNVAFVPSREIYAKPSFHVRLSAFFASIHGGFILPLYKKIPYEKSSPSDDSSSSDEEYPSHGPDVKFCSHRPFP